MVYTDGASPPLYRTGSCGLRARDMKEIPPAMEANAGPRLGRQRSAAFCAPRFRGDRAIDADPPPQCRISGSILIGLIIWICIGVSVVHYVRVHNVETKLPDTRPPIACVEGEQNCTGATTGQYNLEAVPEGCGAAYCGGTRTNMAFGTLLGSHDGVLGFSNCYCATCYSFIDNVIPVGPPPAALVTNITVQPATPRQLSTGMRWQCVEYARRYWMLRGRPEPATFGDVDGAADIWDLLTEAELLDGTRTSLLKFANGEHAKRGGAVPEVGDLLVYPIQKGDFPYGHVAVIVGVDVGGKAVYVAEQNWDNAMWPGPYHNYSRMLSLQYDKSDRAYKIKDHHITIAGWVRPAPRSTPSVAGGRRHDG